MTYIPTDGSVDEAMNADVADLTDAEVKVLTFLAKMTGPVHLPAARVRTLRTKGLLTVYKGRKRNSYLPNYFGDKALFWATQGVTA